VLLLRGGREGGREKGASEICFLQILLLLCHQDFGSRTRDLVVARTGGKPVLLLREGREGGREGGMAKRW